MVWLDGNSSNITLTRVCFYKAKEETIRWYDRPKYWFNLLYLFQIKAWLELLIAIGVSHGGGDIFVHSHSNYSIKTSSSHGDHCSLKNSPKLVEWFSKSSSPPKPCTPLLLSNKIVSSVAICDFLTNYFFSKRYQLRHLNTTHMFENLMAWVADW